MTSAPPSANRIAVHGDRTRRVHTWLLLAATALLALHSPAVAAPADLFPDSTVARGHEFEIKRSELEQAYLAFAAQEASRGRPIPPLRRKQVEADVLDRLIVTRLLARRATEEDRKSAREKTDQALEQARKESASETSFQRRLQAMGTTVEQMQARLFEQYLSEAVLEREVFQKIRISDDEVRKQHTDHPEQYRQPETVRVAHVLLAHRDPITRRELSDSEKAARRPLAEQLVERARKGEDFAALVKEYSDDLPTRSSGGEYTFVRGQASPAFDAAAFALGVGQVSDVVTTPFGFHVIKLIDRKPARDLPLSEVTEAIREQLQRARGREKLPPYFDRLKKDAGVTLDPR